MAPPKTKARRDGLARIALLKEHKRLLEERVAASNLALKVLGFTPHPKQAPVFNCVQDGSGKVVVFQGGNRSGKSVWLVVEVVSFLLGLEPWSGRAMPFSDGPVQVRLFGEDWTHHVGMVLMPLLREYLPIEEVVETKKNNQGIDFYWRVRNGSTLELMTYEQKTDAVEGWRGHVVGMDEPPPRDKYIACRRGLVDFNGVMLMSMTPLKEAWIYDEIVMSREPGVRVFQVDIRDNPHLSEEAIAAFEGSLSVEEKEARLHGKWLHLQGLVYKDFNPGIHVKEPFEIPDNYTCYAAIDCHPRTEHAIVFMAVDKFGRQYVVDEIWRHGSPEDIGDWVVKWHKHVHELETVIIDPSSKGDANRGDTTYEIIDRVMGAAGIGFECGSKDLETGIRVVAEALMGRNRMPSLFIFDTCVKTIYEFGHYIWADWRKSAAQDRTVKQKPTDKDDHMLENIRRLLLLPAEHKQTGYIRGFLQEANQGYQPLDQVAGY